MTVKKPTTISPKRSAAALVASFEATKAATAANQALGEDLHRRAWLVKKIIGKVFSGEAYDREKFGKDLGWVWKFGSAYTLPSDQILRVTDVPSTREITVWFADGSLTDFESWTFNGRNTTTERRMSGVKVQKRFLTCDDRALAKEARRVAWSIKNEIAAEVNKKVVKDTLERQFADAQFEAKRTGGTVQITVVPAAKEDKTA